MSSEDPRTSGTPGADEEELCTQCMAPNRPGAHFCGQCGAPLTSYAATAPFESLFAEGHLYRRAAEQPHNMVVVLGIWLIFGTLGLGGAGIAFVYWDLGSPGGVLVGLGLAVFSGIFIAKTTRHYRGRQKKNDHDQG